LTGTIIDDVDVNYCLVMQGIVFPVNEPKLDLFSLFPAKQAGWAFFLPVKM